MSDQKKDKLKRLQALLPKGGILTHSTLKKQGIYRQLTNRYLNSGWLERVGPAAYKRAGDTVHWVSAVNAIQSQMNLPIHIGAKSALEIKGGAQYLKMGENEIFLFSHLSARNLPKWFVDYKWNAHFTNIKTKLFPKNFNIGLSKEDLNGFEVEVSSKERAIFELLYLLPKKQTWEEADLIFENLISLRPKIIQQILSECSSIKVRRLFLFFSEKHNHQWFSELRLKNVDLGSGDRHLFDGGVLDSKYRITMPESMIEKESEVG